MESATLVINIESGTWYISDQNGNFMQPHEDSVYVGKKVLGQGTINDIDKAIASHNEDVT